MENVVQDGNTILSCIKKGEVPNPHGFLSDLVGFLSTIQKKNENLLAMAECELKNLFSESSINEPEPTNFSDLIEHDPGKRKLVTSFNERKYLIKLGPCQPHLKPFPKNTDITKDRQTRFNPSWYESYNFLEYSVHKDAAFCFACSLFPSSRNQDEAWVCNGVRRWDKMKSHGKAKKGKLLTHFTSDIHKAAVQD